MLEGRRIALVEDDDFMGVSLVQRLELEGAEVLWLKQVNRAIGALRTPRAPFDAVVCDIRLPDGTGEDLFMTLMKTSTPPPFLFITGHGGVEQAVRLMQAGAADYITKPFEISVFLERLALLVSATDRIELPPLLGISPEARRVDELALKAAESDTPVLIRGGLGVGKGLVARRIHELSDRRAAPFISINAARVPNVHEALFGQNGVFERVGEGTLFVQALSRLPGETQQTLLLKLDAGFSGRVIGSCGLDLQTTVERQGFNADLYYRLTATEIPIPPLSDRPEDAVWLMSQIFEKTNSERKQPLRGISRLTEEIVRSHDWPGGGREVRSRVVGGVMAASGDHLQPLDLFPERIASGDRIQSLAAAREQAEKRQILHALDLTSGQVGEAAKLLKVSRTTLWEKMRKLEIDAGSE